MNNSPLVFYLDLGNDVPEVRPHVAKLAKCLCRKIDTGVTNTGIAREIAMIVHRHYQYSDYDSPQRDEYLAAMFLVSIAMIIGSMHGLVHAPASDQDHYALNLAAIGDYGILDKLLSCTSEKGQGVYIHDLQWAASTIWGGAMNKHQRSGNQKGLILDIGLVGIVAPHCVILLDLIRDPLRFARDGMQGKLLTMCRVSVPMLPRDPQSGLMYGADVRSRQHISEVLNIHTLQSIEVTQVSV